MLKNRLTKKHGFSINRTWFTVSIASWVRRWRYSRRQRTRWFVRLFRCVARLFKR